MPKKTMRFKLGRPLQYTIPYIEKLAKKMIRWAEKYEGIPFLCTFAVSQGFSEARLKEFAVRSEFFASAVEYLKSIQKSKLLEQSIAGKIDRGMASLILKTTHGFVERKEVKADVSFSKLVVEIVRGEGGEEGKGDSSI